MAKENCTWKKVDGRYRCMATKCLHWLKEGKCELGKVTLTCDNIDCIHNTDNRCLSMDVHLDADGSCLGIKKK